jgi:hypothetical protein
MNNLILYVHAIIKQKPPMPFTGFALDFCVGKLELKKKHSKKLYKAAASKGIYTCKIHNRMGS